MWRHAIFSTMPTLIGSVEGWDGRSGGKCRAGDQVVLFLLLQDRKLTAEELLERFDILVESSITNKGYAVHEEL